MRNFLFFVCIFITLVTSSCKKSDTNSQTDCQINNYGTLKVVFGSSSIKHHILVQIGFGFREKYYNAGVLSDTFHLAPETYSVFIYSTDDVGAAIDTKNVTTTISQCNESIESVVF